MVGNITVVNRYGFDTTQLIHDFLMYSTAGFPTGTSTNQGGVDKLAGAFWVDRLMTTREMWNLAQGWGMPAPP